MWYDDPMIDSPIGALLDDSSCMLWLEGHLHSDDLQCPCGRRMKRRLFREQGLFPAYRCRACDGYYSLLPGTVFEKARQRPATLVLLLRGMTEGERTARLAHELGLSRKQLHTLRRRLQAHLHEIALTDVMMSPAFEADEPYHNAGEKTHAPS
jgi:hypothetical protein